jgi:hypothetical protein
MFGNKLGRDFNRLAQVEALCQRASRTARGAMFRLAVRGSQSNRFSPLAACIHYQGQTAEV